MAKDNTKALTELQAIAAEAFALADGKIENAVERDVVGWDAGVVKVREPQSLLVAEAGFTEKFNVLGHRRPAASILPRSVSAIDTR